MNKIISLLLILLIVFGQILPHSHAGTGVSEPDGHDLLPHVHLHGHNHAHHRGDHDHPSSEGNKKSYGDEFSPASDHDSDAVYLALSTKLPRMRPSISVDVLLTCWISVPSQDVVVEQSRYYIEDPPDGHARLPIYLLKSSLLI